MQFRRREVLKLATSSAAAAVATKLGTRSAWAARPSYVTRDVVVIGGGSAGTYAAVRLRNLGKTVAVLEKQGRLGGHAQTVFVDDLPINLGVQVLEGSNPLVTSYCASLNVPLVPLSFAGAPPPANVDFRTGTPVTVAPTDPVALETALGTYLQLLATEYPYLDNGFELPNPVPADLLLPFGDFATKYNLDALIPTAFQFGEGAGDLLSNPAIYVMKLFGLSVVSALAANAFVTVPTGLASLYDAAASFLGIDAHVDTEVLGVVRYPDHVEVFAETPDGPLIIHASKLVFAIPPTLRNLALLAPDDEELSLFCRFQSTYYATSLIQFEGLPPGVGISNVAANTRANLPVLPGLYGLELTAVPNYFVGTFGNPTWLPDDVVKQTIVSSLRKVAASGIYPSLKLGSLQDFSSHAPFHMTVPAADIAAGFWSRVNALQGRNRTFFTGASFQTNDSSLIWRFTESLLPQITA